MPNSAVGPSLEAAWEPQHLAGNSVRLQHLGCMWSTSALRSSSEKLHPNLKMSGSSMAPDA